MKVMTIIGTRPEAIKLSRVISELDHQVEHVLVHTGQNYDYELNEIFFNQMTIRKPDFFLNAAEKSVAETIGKIIYEVDLLLDQEKPEAVLLLGDTNSCLSAIPAKRRRIPVFHMEAGNRCFDDRVPEEINRRIVDHISDINMPYTEHARRYLIREGIKPETIIKTGSPMKEVLTYYRDKIESSQVLRELNLKTKAYFLVSAHREENIDFDTNFNKLLESLNAIAATFQKPVIVSTHPRTRKRLDEGLVGESHKLIRFLKPLGFFEYIKLQTKALCIISDSGTITEEAALLDLPAVTIREVHERPEGMDSGTLIMCGLTPEKVLEAINTVINQNADLDCRAGKVADYEVADVSKKVTRIILSYTEYVNRTAWYNR